MEAYQAPGNYAYMNKSADQAKQRRNVRLEDQFGRWWGTAVEKSTGDPCCEISPDGGWVDPLNTPNAYLRVPKHADGMPIPGKIAVTFDRWIESVQGSTEDWDKLIDKAGRETYKLVTREERMEWPKDPVLLALAGPRPLPTVETLIKARDGDKTLLGLTTNAQTGETHPADITYKEFMVENRRDEFDKPRTMAAIGQLWKEHRAFLADVVIPEPEPVEAEV
jgi:hypothetical protein